MSLGKSPTLAPAGLDANRTNAQKTTGTRTAREGPVTDERRLTLRGAKRILFSSARSRNVIENKVGIAS
jgi:hypothetical protein